MRSMQISIPIPGKKTAQHTALAVAALLIALFLSACTGESQAQKTAQETSKQLQSKVYAQKNNLEFNNYNQRQHIADDPSTIMWCTAYLNNPNVKPITVPIVGKLTSSKKRPYPTTTVANNDTNTSELPGPDAMYGDSTEYRYGFTPGGVYFDFTDVSTVCTTEPTVYQATKTQLVLQTDAQLNSAAQEARAALKAGAKPGGVVSKEAGDKAERILEQATGGN
jgi:hypothetical protein